ncbi:MAG: WXG100 family type VII secretion target [Lachnospiraceae bacterium]|nr:WXG100 family type VII secretion target [Lachnospiraceae bacterium]
MALIRVTSASLTKQANTLRQTNANYKAQVTALNQTEAALNNMWEGDANTAFHTAFQSDKAQMDKFYQAIEKYITALETIIQKYEKAEAANAQTAKTRSYK